MFCTECGARIPKDSLFCPVCGTRLEAVTEAAPPPVGSGDYPNVTANRFIRTQTMTEAADLAISTNTSGEWSYWDSPGRYTVSVNKLHRESEKEDKRISKLDDRGGIQYYTVSPCGSVGQVYEDEWEPGKFILEWVYYAPGEGAEDLPETPEEL